MTPKTLAVLRLDGTPAVIADQVAGLVEGLGDSLVLVTVGPKALLPENLAAAPAVVCEAAPNRRFDWAQGVLAAIEAGIQFSQVFALSSDTLLLRRGLPQWLASQIEYHGRVVIGVRDSTSYASELDAMVGVLYEWDWPTNLLEVSAENLADGFFLSSRAVLEELYQRHWLVPPGCQRWPLPYGVYLSWLMYSLGNSVKYLGQTDRPQPPLYLSEQRNWQPSPHVLSAEFLVYHSAKRVTGYAEESVRAWAKAQRTGAL